MWTRISSKGLLTEIALRNIYKLIFYRITLEHLEDIGLVNKPLLNPVPTMREYFWLFMIVGLENLIALGIELINGGVWTQQVWRGGIGVFCSYLSNTL